jgi:hypothetical protein
VLGKLHQGRQEQAALRADVPVMDGTDMETSRECVIDVTWSMPDH